MPLSVLLESAWLPAGGRERRFRADNNPQQKETLIGLLLTYRRTAPFVSRLRPSRAISARREHGAGRGQTRGSDWNRQNALPGDGLGEEAGEHPRPCCGKVRRWGSYQ